MTLTKKRTKGQTRAHRRMHYPPRIYPLLNHIQPWNITSLPLYCGAILGLSFIVAPCLLGIEVYVRYPSRISRFMAMTSS